jgi:hypothetical protein
MIATFFAGIILAMVNMPPDRLSLNGLDKNDRVLFQLLKDHVEGVEKLLVVLRKRNIDPKLVKSLEEEIAETRKHQEPILSRRRAMPK